MLYSPFKDTDYVGAITVAQQKALKLSGASQNHLQALGANQRPAQGQSDLCPARLFYECFCHDVSPGPLFAAISAALAGALAAQR